MKLRRRVLLALAVLLIAAVAALFFFTRPPPVLTVMTWPGVYGRAQTNAQMHPFSAETNIDVRPAFWDGDLADVQAMVNKGQFKADVIDFELPKAVQACRPAPMAPRPRAISCPDQSAPAGSAARSIPR
jgi:spermidine/putrescine-binding protein